MESFDENELLAIANGVDTSSNVEAELDENELLAIANGGDISKPVSQSVAKDNSLPAEQVLGEYDTKLNPEEERQYQKWRQTLPKNLQYEGDYDLRGYWKDPETAKEAVGGDHFIDKYKKPNHPTFSNESQYAVGENAKKAGRWEGERYIPASQKRGITMSADEMNVPQSAILSKDEAKEMGEMNANEVAARSYEQATGVDAPDNKILAHIANMGSNVGGRLNANLQMQAAQELLSKSGNRSDDETRGLFSKMILGATKYLGGRLFVDDALDEWDETEGKSYKTPEERTRARNAFVDELARQFIVERTATKHNATAELDNREQGFWATVLGEGPAQVGNSLPYMLGPVGIALQFAQQSAATGVDYANDEYGFAKDGSLGVVAEGDSAGRAAVKGIASGAFETGSEIIGGKVAGAVGKRLGKVLSKGGKVLVGKFPVIAEKAGKMAETKVGTAVSKFGTGMKNLFAWTSKKLHLENPIEENIEEWETENLNALFGTGARDSQYVDPETGVRLDTWDRIKEANAEFFKPENLIKLNEAMLLTMGGGAFISHMAQRGMKKEVDSFLREHKLMTEEEIASTDLQTKAQALDAWSKGLSEEEVLTKINSATSLVDKLADKIATEPSQAQKAVTLKRHLSEMNDFNSLIERAGEIDKAVKEQGGTTKRFTVQQDENGNPKFNTTIGVDFVTGENVTRNEMHDADVGVTVVDNNGTYIVRSDVTGEKFKTSNFNRAINAADAMAVLNQQRVAERQTKIQVLENLSQNEAYANRKIEVFETADQARQAIGGDFENDAPGFTTEDGTTVLILDNLDNPATALAALDKGTESDRGAFPDGVNFEAVAEKDDDGEVVETRVARDKVHDVTIIENPDGNGFTVFGKDVPYTNVATVEEATALARGEKIETPKEEVINETRTDEAQPQPEQAQPVPPSAGEEARPVEAGEASPEVGREVDDLRDISNKATQELMDAETKLSKWLKEHPRQTTEDGRVSYSNGGTTREFKALEAAVDAAKEKADNAENAYRKAERAERQVKAQAKADKEAAAKSRREQEKQKYRTENPITAQLNDLEKNVLLPAEIELEDLVDSDSATNEQKSEAYRKLKEARKTVNDFKEQHKDELAQELKNRELREREGRPATGEATPEVGGEIKSTVDFGNRKVPTDIKEYPLETQRRFVLLDDMPVGVEVHINEYANGDGRNYRKTNRVDSDGVPWWIEIDRDGNEMYGGRKSEQAHLANLGTHTILNKSVENPTSASTEAQVNTPSATTESAEGGSQAADAVQNIADKKTAHVDEKATENADSAAQQPETEPAPLEVDEAKSIKKRLEKKRNKGFALTDEETALLGRAEEAIKADVKAKRDASRAATLEKAKAVQPPSWMGKNAGPEATRVNDLTNYLANRGHNRSSLHRAIQSVRDYMKKQGALALPKDDDKATLADALEKATKRLAKMKNDDQKAFAERNADMPTSQLKKYLEDTPNNLLSHWLENNGALLKRPRSASAAKKAAGGKGALRDAKFDGKLFDPNSVGADELNHFFDGMPESERNKWLKLLFGKDTKEEKEPTVTGNDVTLEKLGLSMGEALDAFREAYGEFQEWREKGSESDEEAYYRNQYEEEQSALDEEFGPVAEYALDELAAREAADKEYANAMAYVENKATAKDVAVLKPSNLSAAAEGDKIRVDHHKKTFDFLDYDAENGILYLEDRVEVETDEGSYLAPETRYYRVSEDAISEITKEQANGFRNETGTSDNRASDEKGASRGGSREESGKTGATEKGSDNRFSDRGGSRQNANGGRGSSSDADAVRSSSESAAGGFRDGERENNRKKREAYNRVANALDPAWRAKHPDEVAKLESEGMSVSAVASNPNVSGTDKISWPVTATHVNDREDAANIFRLLSDPGKEITKVLYLDRDGKIVGRRVVAVGLVGTTPANIEAVLNNVPKDAYGIVFSHNHPAEQGDSVRPTPDDVKITRTLKTAVEKKGLQLLDHIITDHNAYESLGTRDASLASEGAAEFWDRAVERYAFEGPGAEKPEDMMNLVPYDERIDMTKDVRGKLNALAAIASKAHDKSSWVVGIDNRGMAVWIEAAPANADAAGLGKWLDAHPGANRFAVLNGENAVDLPSFINAIEQEWKNKTGGDDSSRPLLVAVGEKGKLTEFEENGLNDKILNTAKATPTPRLANAPKLDDETTKEIADILGDIGGLLRFTVVPISSSRITPAEDAAYLDAVKRGDMETAQKMVREAAAKAMPDTKVVGEDGLPLTVYHGTYQHGFTVFKAKDEGVYTTSSKENAEGYSFGKNSGIYDLFLDAKNPLIVDAEGSKWSGMKFKGIEKFKKALNTRVISPADLAVYAREHGYDGVIIKNVFDGDVMGDDVIVYQPTQIKSADPVTYDDAGNVIPLSQRFNPNNDSILYSPVEPLSLSDEEEDKFFSSVRRMAKALKAKGYNTFEDMIRTVASMRPDIYERGKDLFRRAWNFYDVETDGITIAQGKQIFGKIDTELKETTNDNRRSEPQAVSDGGAQSDRGGQAGRGADRTLAPSVGDSRMGSRDSDNGTVAGYEPTNEYERGGDGSDGSQSGEAVLGGGYEGDGGESDRLRPDERRSDVRADAEQSVPVGSVQSVEATEEVTPGFMEYQPPADLPVAAPKSKSLIVESSALASVTPPKIETKPKIPDTIPSDGVLQAHQYQAVCQAVNAHNKLLPDGRRMGYFCGDGTGVGKTRTIAGVLLDAMNRKLGKGKALIVSKNSDLFDSAKSDFEHFDGLADKLFKLDDKGRKRLSFGTGIAFTTYDGLTENYAGTDAEGNIRSAGKRGKTTSRYAELVRWLGKDFDGVIAFDEAHSAAKDDGSGASPKGQVKRAQAVIDLQAALPNARILYLTATSAYDAEDLRFLQRMGLWGEGTGFRNLEEFSEAINKGGLSMMEMLTQGMKARGLYCSRSISFKGVTCRREVAVMTPEQKEVYDNYRSIITAIHDKLAELSSYTGDKPAQLTKMYFGRALDLFNSVITAMKVQKAIEIGRQAIADGKSPVFQLISTNEAAKNAKNGGKKKRTEIDLFSTPQEVAEQEEQEVGVKDRVISYLKGNGFPIREWLEQTDSQGKHLRGEIIPEAAALRDEMIALAETLPDVGNPIDELVKAFQDVGISRISSGSNKNAEADAFNSGKHLALVFSGAGGTGASYHADQRFKNTRQRVQIPIEFGWEPDKFIQALGRSHRNNQVMPPEFVLLTTDIAGEMRFMSTIANRVASMGAIVGGDRNSSGQVVSAADSMDNTYGRTAIKNVARNLASGQVIGDVSGIQALHSMFLNPDKIDKLEANKFLGRLQFLSVDDQNEIYSAIASATEMAIAAAKADGTYDDGIRKIEANRTIVKSRQTLSKGDSDTETRELLTTSEWYDSRRITHEELEERAPHGQSVEYVRNKRSGKLYGIFQNGNRIARLAPDGTYVTIQPLERGNYETVINKDAARKEWDDEYSKLPAEVEKINHYMAGDLIPVWDKIGIQSRPFVYRGAPVGSKPFIGVHITDAQLPITLYGFDKKEEARKFFNDNAYRLASREGMKVGLTAARHENDQPYFKRAKNGTRYVLTAFKVPDGSSMADDFIESGWNSTWAKDENNPFDRGGTVYYRELGEDAEAAFNEIINKYGVVIYRGDKAVFESRDDLAPMPIERTPVRRETASSRSTADTSRGGSLGARLGMPNMRMRVERGELIITNTDARFKNDLKLAFGGEWANRARDGKRYVKSDLRWNKPPVGRGGWWSIPLNKVPANILAEVESDGMLHAPVAPLSSVKEMDRDGGVARLSQNPDEFKTNFVYNLLRAEVMPLGDSNNKVISEKELLRRAIDDGEMSAIGELYNRYMAPNAAKGGLKGLIRRAAARKGMERVMNESRIEEVASLVWAGSSMDGGYELNRRGIIADINAGDTEIYKKTGSLIPVMTEKVDRILNDMAERAKNRPEMQTLDAPSITREGESELDQQIADDTGVVEGLYGADTQNEYVESADYINTVLADKLHDAGEVAGRRLTASERNRLNAMDMLDELMYFLPEEYQDVLNAVLSAERERGLTSNNSHRDAQGRKVAAASIEKAQAASGLSKRVFNARLVEARKLMNEIWENIRNGKSDDNIAIKIGEFVGAEETDEELNESILEGMSENASTSDMALATRLLLRGESVEDVAYFFDISPAMVRAWKARARNEHLIVFPGDEAENTLGFENFPERKAVKRGARSGATRKARSTAWTPDLFPSANATVNDKTAEEIDKLIFLDFSNEDIAKFAHTSPEVVKLHRIHDKIVNEEPIDATKVRSGNQSELKKSSSKYYKRILEEKEKSAPVDYFADIRNKPKEGFLFAPVAPLEQETLGIEAPVFEEAMGFANAEMNKWRSVNHLPELPKTKSVSLDSLDRQGAAIANNADEMRKMIERLERAPYALNAVDQDALGRFTTMLKFEYNTLAVKKREAHDNGNDALAIQYDMEMDELLSWINRADHVNKNVGTEWGRAGRIRQITIDKAGNLADYMVSCARAKGSPLTKSEKAEAELIYRKFEEAREKNENLKLEDIISQLDALSNIRLARQQDGIKERKGKYTPDNIERDYVEALAQIRYHGEHRSGGVLHGLPNGQKWIRAIEAYHLMNGEGLTDGKPDGAKMAQLILDDVLSQGVTASLWDVRQMESRMGNLIKPSQDEISKSLRDLHSQMLIEQQIEHILATGEMPPKTGFDRDEESVAVRQLRRERDRIVREKGIDRRTYEERLKTALDSYKTRLRNQIEENEKAIADIEAGRPYTPRTNRKLTLDEEAQALKERNKELKDRIKELTDDPAKNQEKRIERALAAVGRHITIRKEQIAAINAGTFDFDKKREKLESPELTAARDELKKLNEDFKALKKALYPNGTDAEIAHRLKMREAALEKQYNRWNKMAADYSTADTWEARWAAVAPSAKKPPLESEATRKMAKDRDAAHRKVLEFRKRLELEDTRGEAAKAWARFIGGISVLARAIYDMSVIGVQGGKFLRSHPIKGVKIGWKATKAFFKKNASDTLTTEIANHPYFEDFKNNGGHIYAMDGLEGDTPEDFRVLEQGAPLPKGKMLTVDMIPGVKRSSRSFAGFLNKAALELYSDIVEAAGANGTGATAEQKKLIADFVNISLGYGYGKKNVGKKLSLIPAVLDAIAWAPRKAVAELKYATLYPLATNWMGTRKHEISGKEIWSVDKAIGREYLRYTLGSLAFGACMVLLAKLFNGDDDDDRNVWSDILDPRSSDFGRVRVGNTSYSVFAGNEMVWRLFARLYAGQTKTNGVVKDYKYHGVEAALNYLRGKLNPLLGATVDYWMDRNFVGEKLSEKSAWELVSDYALPLTASAIYENFAKNPDDPLAAIFNAAPTFFGMTSYTYERDPLARVVKQGDEAVRIAKSSGDKATAERIGASLKGERTEVYGAAKEVLKLEKKLKELKAMKSESADVKNAIKELEKVIPEKRKAAMELYRRTRNSGIKWDNMEWTE